MIIGMRRAISTSKIKKIIAIRKKLMENGMRENLFGSNPHSNGEFFSRSKNLFLDRIVDRIIIIVDRINVIILIINLIFITYIISKSFNWKLNIIFILYKYLPHQ
jgi:hypothetical protein